METSRWYSSIDDISFAFRLESSYYRIAFLYSIFVFSFSSRNNLNAEEKNRAWSNIQRDIFVAMCIWKRNKVWDATRDDWRSLSEEILSVSTNLMSQKLKQLTYGSSESYFASHRHSDRERGKWKTYLLAILLWSRTRAKRISLSSLCSSSPWHKLFFSFC